MSRIKNLFSDREFNRGLLSLMVPIALQNLILNAVSFGDTFMLGFVSQESFSAVSLASQVYFVMSLFIGTLTGGATMLASQYLGKGDRRTVERVFCTILRYCALVSILFFCLGFFLPEALMWAFTDTQEMITIGAGYIRICSFSYLFAGFSQCYLCILKVDGRAKVCTIITTAVVALDLILNAIFIFGLLGLPPMGADGAALTTSISKFVELVLILGYTFSVRCLKPKLQDLASILPKLEKEFWKYTFPISINAAAWGVGITIYSMTIGHLGTDVTAAYTVTTVIKNLVVSLSTGLANACGILLGKVLGENNLDRGREYGARFSKLSILCGLVCAGLSLLLGPAITSIFKTSAGARDLLGLMLIFCAVNCIGRCINDTVICGVFLAGGDSAFDAQSIVATMWGVIIPLSLCAAFWWDLPAIWVYFIISMDEIIKLPWVYAHYKKYIWVKNITRDDLTAL